MRQLTAKYNGKCANHKCGKEIRKGETIGYEYKRAYCSECLDQYDRENAAARFDEMQYQSQYGGY